METREQSEQLSYMAAQLISAMPELEYIALSNVRIAYLLSDSEKKKGSKLVFGQCEKVPPKYQWSVPYDFTITFFQPNIERFTEDQLMILMFHELLHIGIEEDGNEEKYFVNEHDYEEFRTIIDRYGLDWSM